MILPTPLPLVCLPLTPLIGCLLVLGIGRFSVDSSRKVALAWSLLTLLLAVSAVRSGARAGDVQSWIPALGASLQFEIEGVSHLFVGWTALLGLLAVACVPPLAFEPRSAALALFVEGMLLGLFVAADVLLLVAFYGAAVLGFAALAHPERRYLSYQLVSLGFLTAFFLLCYQLVFEQTGFVSTELARWRTLVLYPDAQLRLFVLATASVLFVLPVFPCSGWLVATVEAMPLPGRLLLLGGFSLAGMDVLLRVIGPVISVGGRGASALALILPALSIFYALVARPRAESRWGWVPLIVGFQGLVLAGVLSFEEGLVARSIVLALALVAATTALGVVATAAPAEDAAPSWWMRCLAGAPMLLVATGSLLGMLSTWNDSDALSRLVWLGAVPLLWKLLRVFGHVTRARNEARVIAVLFTLFIGLATLAAGGRLMERVGTTAGRFVAAPDGSSP